MRLLGCPFREILRLVSAVLDYMLNEYETHSDNEISEFYKHSNMAFFVTQNDVLHLNERFIYIVILMTTSYLLCNRQHQFSVTVIVWLNIDRKPLLHILWKWYRTTKCCLLLKYSSHFLLVTKRSLTFLGKCLMNWIIPPTY
jgi:hypothetical protein